jgi:hypothetical protein
MTSLRLRRGVALAALLLPAAPFACTADQFTGSDSGVDSGSGTDTGSASDAAGDERPKDDGATVIDGGGQVDAPGNPDDAGKEAGILDGSCVPEASSVGFSCGNTTCATAATYCNDVKQTCQAIPSSCACDHTCNCLLTALPNFCGGDASAPHCSDNSGELTLSCQ